MPTKEGWPTIDEERAMRDRARTLRKNPAATLSTDTLPMSVSMTVGQWKALLAGDATACGYVRGMLESHIDMAAQVR
jgi:hypothetical protein